MSIRRFNDMYGRPAWAVTHVDAVVGLDGKPLTQTIKNLEAQIPVIRVVEELPATLEPDVFYAVVEGSE